MGEKLDKFLLLMWKNWMLQYRKPIQTFIEILSPVLFALLLVLTRRFADPKMQETKMYSPFCTIPINYTTADGINLCPNFENITSLSNMTADITLVYSPNGSCFDSAMDFFRPTVANIIGVGSAEELVKYTINADAKYVGIEFPDEYRNVADWKLIKDLSVSLRFPGETTYQSGSDDISGDNWRTDLAFPILQTMGPRAPDEETGGAPSYFMEGFLTVQHLLTASLILARNGQTSATAPQWLIDNHFPMIYMRRFPYSSWYADALINALEPVIGMIIMLGFVYSCINTVKTITAEKEKQLKESMKIMGLPNWLHWTAWFLKCFIQLLISVIIMVILVKVTWFSGSDYTIFTNADPSVLLVFLILYICSTITFCFALSVFFSKANTAATMAGLAWFLSYMPYVFMQNNYEDLSLAVKLITSLFTNTAMAFGFQVILMYEGAGEGISWDNLFTPITPDDNLGLGHIWIMLIVNSLLYLFIALYVESVFPGEYGVPQPWYYLFTSTYWFGQKAGAETINPIGAQDKECFESEPTNLKPGIQIRNLRKEFGKKTAVRNLSLNMYQGQITVLLGHNGAGKTTTMSMLTGMITPTSGTAKINGYDIKSEMTGVRGSLGLCPQHNIIFDELTVSEHLYFFSKLKGLNKTEIKDEIDKYVKLLDLEPKRNSQSKTLSGGMKRKLCVGIALCGNSKVVMLDEPTAGVDPSARRVLWELLQVQKEGRTILLSTHFMDEADLLGDRIGIMAGGELQCCGSSFFLKKKYGAGYSLIMDKTRECQPDRITELIRKYIPDIKIHSNVGSELTYLLTDDYASVFEALLKQLELESKSLGIQSYGISLTTLEEVFMKVGADHGQEEMYNDMENKKKMDDKPVKNYDKASIALTPTYTGGTNLVINQIMAILMKKFIACTRSWILLVIQIAIPAISIILVMSVPQKVNKNTELLPSMPLDLSRFQDPITLTEGNSFDYDATYNSVLSDYGSSASLIGNIIDDMLNLTKTNPIRVRRQYIVGASFEDLTVNVPVGPVNVSTILPKITAWFNNDPFHSPGISMGFVLSTVYKKLVNCDNCNLRFTNKPLPYKAETQITRLNSAMTRGFQMAFNIGFSMAFVTAFYAIFLVRENVSKSKHLQFVSGVKVWVFWIMSIIFDMATYTLTIIVLLIAIACFQQDGFQSVEQIGILFTSLFCFGCAALPLTYLLSFGFDVPSTGYTRLTLVSIFLGNAAFLLVTILKTPTLNMEETADQLYNVFIFYPHFSLSTAINDYFTKYSYKNLCDKYFEPALEACKQQGFSYEECLEKLSSLTSTCVDRNDNYFEWATPGIGKNLVIPILSGIFFFALLLAAEYKLFSRFVYYFNQKWNPRYPIDVHDEDDDVAREKEMIRDATEMQIQSKYTLAIKDLTKYYKKFLAVNGLSMGVGKSECFGLLGVNGAGKTTTFKMMSGDESISYGDGWVNGKSIKSQLKEVQRNIGYCPQFDALLDDMTARETITMYCLLRGIERNNCNTIADFLSKEFDFNRHLGKKVKEMSGGNKRKLSTVLSLIGDPPVLFLDEPTTGMDPATKRYLWDALSKVRDGGKTIILTSHSMEECEALCTRIAIMVNGNFKCLGSSQHLKNKFAEGYTLTIKVEKLPQSSGLEHADTAPIENFIQENFRDARLREKHQELLNYYIVDKSMPWSTMFGILERGKRSNLHIEDYSLGQSSLEQVFLTFAKQQTEEGAENDGPKK